MSKKIKQRLYQLLKRISAIDWRKGSGSIVFYIAMLWVISLIGLMFIEYYHTFSNGVKTQLAADIIADGAAFNGDNGWGLDKEKARVTAQKLTRMNKAEIDHVSTSITFSTTDSKGNIIKNAPASENNTVHAKSKLKAKTLYDKKSLRSMKKASTKITYMGGMRIVIEAYKHSWQYSIKNGTNSQTQYVWGGGHGSDDLSWEQYADCSGFVSGVFRKCGYYIPSWACTWNMESMGNLVGTGVGAYEAARPGDIILFWWNSAGGPSDHVAIYAGKKNGNHYMIHSRGGSSNTILSPGSGPSGGVNLTPVATGAAQIMVRRIVRSSAQVYETPEQSIHGLSADESIIYSGLSAAGYSDICIAAIMGNWMGEGMNRSTTVEGHYSYGPGSYNETYAENIRNGLVSKADFVYDGYGSTGHMGGWGYGIAQWTTVDWANPFSDRKAQLWDFAKARGSNVTDLYTQVAFAIQEFSTTRPSINSPAFRNITDIGAATRFFIKNYEGIYDASVPKRTLWAQYYYYTITGQSALANSIYNQVVNM